MSEEKREPLKCRGTFARELMCEPCQADRNRAAWARYALDIAPSMTGLECERLAIRLGCVPPCPPQIWDMGRDQLRELVAAGFGGES